MKSLGPGTIIDDSLLIEELIGQGGMGSVYRAAQPSLGRLVALKMLPELRLIDEESRQRFKREARALALFEHKNIVAFYNYGIWKEQTPYITMEFLQGQGLDSIIAAGKISAERIRHLLLQVCDALDYAHSKGVVHRDLKPANIIVVQEPEADTVKLVDFGLAKFLPSKVEVSQKLTETGLLIGSVNYMSPEQCLCKNVDERSDVYSLGCICYQLIYGSAPFDSESPIVAVSKQINEEFPDLALRENSQIFKDLAIVVRNCVNKDPSERYQSISLLKQDLAQVGNGAIVEMHPSARAGGKTRTAILILTAIFAFLGLAGYLFNDSFLPAIQSEYLKNFGDKDSWRTALLQADLLRERGKQQYSAELLQSALFLARKFKQPTVVIAGIETELARVYEEIQLKGSATKYAGEAFKDYVSASTNVSWEKLQSQKFSEGLRELLSVFTMLRPDKQAVSLDNDMLLQRLEDNHDFETARKLAEFQVAVARASVQTDHHETRENVLRAQSRLALSLFRAGNSSEACAQMKQILNKAQQLESAQELAFGLNQYASFLGDQERPVLQPFGKVCEQILSTRTSIDPVHKIITLHWLCHFYIKCKDKENAEYARSQAADVLAEAKPDADLEAYWNRYIQQADISCELGKEAEAFSAFKSGVDCLEHFQAKSSYYAENSLLKIINSCLKDYPDNKQMMSLVKELELLGRKADEVHEETLLNYLYRCSHVLKDNIAADIYLDRLIELRRKSGALAPLLAAMQLKALDMISAGQDKEAIAELARIRKQGFASGLKTTADYEAMAEITCYETIMLVLNNYPTEAETILSDFYVPPAESTLKLRNLLDLSRLFLYASRGRMEKAQALLDDFETRPEPRLSPVWVTLAKAADYLSRDDKVHANQCVEQVKNEYPELATSNFLVKQICLRLQKSGLGR